MRAVTTTRWRPTANTVRALEDKFYSIELNHVPRWYNKEVDELAKIVSGRITCWGISENPDEIPEHESKFRVHVQVE
jgi:hypothetical protein